MSTRQDPRAALAPGIVLDDRFRIRDLLGAGSFGQVYSADQVLFGRPVRKVALKLFFSDAVTPENAQSVLSDALTLISLQEEHAPPEVLRGLVQVFDMGLLDRQRAFMSMRLVPGSRTLLDAVRRHGTCGMPVDLAFRFLRQMLVPLAWMHALDPPLVHGDLKPDNVLLTTDTELVLTDFGLAARLPLGTRGGAIAYQAPETLNGLAGGTPSDMYSVGIMWYELLTGRHPFAGVGEEFESGESAYVAAHRQARKRDVRLSRSRDPRGDTERIVPPDEINPEVARHPQVVQMLARCLRWHESERYPDAGALLKDVDAYLHDGVVRGLLTARIIGGPAPRSSPTAGPDLAEVRFADAVAEQAQGRFTEALVRVDGLIAEGHQSVRNWVLKARLELQLKDLDRAGKSATEARRLGPQSPEACEVMAEVLQAMNRPEMAKSFFAKSRELRQGMRT